MKDSFKFSKAFKAVACSLLLAMSQPALAVDFDYDEVLVDGIMYGIVGTEAPYSAYVVEYYDWDMDEYMYSGEITVPATIEFDGGKEATVVGIDDDAFSYCPVTMVTLPNTVESIGKRAFGTCSQLTCVKMGSGVKTILSKAFYPDAKLTTMYLDAVEPPTIASDALPINPSAVTLYVPAGCVDTYKETDIWKTLGNITTSDDVVLVSEIIVTPAEANVAEMGTIILTATVYPAEAQQKVSWSSSDTSVARVSGTGEVFGVKSGICTITASATDGSGVKGECTLTVGSGKLLQLNTPFISGYPDEEFQLTAEVSPEDTTVEWSVADASVSSIEADGLEANVKLLAPGQTLITVTASNGLSATVDVTVKEFVALTAIEVNPSIIECEVGDRIMLSEFNITPVPENVSIFNPTFSIEDTSIVDYDPEDYDMETFECLKDGTTRFVWSQDDIQGYCKIVVGDAVGVKGLSSKVANGKAGHTVMSIDGVVLMRDASLADIESLPAGFYLIDGKKHLQSPRK